MPEYNGNDIYLTINGVNTGARWRSFEMGVNIGDEDVSAGAGIKWEEYADKLRNINATITLVYNDLDAAQDFADLHTENAIVAVVYGPENAVPGKPKHDQDFKIRKISGPTTNYNKTLVTLQYDCISTGAPRSDLYAGDTFA